MGYSQQHLPSCGGAGASDISAKWVMGLDSKRSFVDSKSVGISGVRGGVLFEKKYEVGLGVYGSGLWGKKVNKVYVDKSMNPNIEFNAEVSFAYVSIYNEYRFIDNGKWKFVANTQFGYGNVFLDLSDQNDVFVRDIVKDKVLMEHSVKAKRSITPWAGLVGGVGYRYLVNEKDNQIKKAFNAPIYVVSISLDFVELFKTISEKKKEDQ